MEDFVDTAIAEAKANEAAQPQATEPVVEEKQVEEAPQAEITEEEKERRKLENALSYQRKQRSKAQQEAKETRTRLEQLEKQLAQNKPKADDAPNEANYNSYSEFLEAKQEYLLEKKLAERDAKAKESQAVATNQQEETKRYQSFDKASQTFEKEVADASQVFEQNIESIRDLWTNETLRNVILKAENAPLALYNLAKEGKLDQLLDMDAIDAAVEIRLAQRNAPTHPQTKAPPPIAAARGAASASKTLNNMTPDEIGKWLNS